MNWSSGYYILLLLVASTASKDNFMVMMTTMARCQRKEPNARATSTVAARVVMMHMVRSYLTHELEQISMRKLVGETAISGHMDAFPVIKWRI
jgi:hypothetical protein